jgi:hypothetical protein
MGTARMGTHRANSVVDAYGRGYYSQPTIVRLLSMEGRPPQPRGYHLEPLDLGLLDNIK